MNDKEILDIPVQYQNIKSETEALDFNMSSDLFTGSLLKTLVASKPGGRFLELGTGTGLATSWILSGMDKESFLVSIENNELLVEVAKKNINDTRANFLVADGYKWITGYQGKRFDFIFADAMPGKYDLFDETFNLLNEGGLYIIDDMLPHINWPVGHDKKVIDFIYMLEMRKDLVLTKMNWSTGIIIISKKSISL